MFLCYILFVEIAGEGHLILVYKYMKNKPFFIVQPNPADYMTLLAMFFSGISIIQILSRNFYLAISFMFMSTISDIFDGFLARKFGWESEFGRYLDSFVDMFNYLFIPALFFYVYGLNDLVATLVFFVFISAGMLRLTRFNIIGNLKEGDRVLYLGLPVGWNQMVFLLLFIASWYIPKETFSLLTQLSLLGLSFGMLLNRKFWKPQQTFLITLAGLILILSICFFYLQFFGH